jgi:hypothetical protein
MRPIKRAAATVAVSAAVLAVSLGRVAGVAMADETVPLGGGAGITVAGNPCTLTTMWWRWWAVDAARRWFRPDSASC